MANALNVNELIVHRSDRSGFDDLSVTIHEFPANAPPSMTPSSDAYTFWYRPRAEKGDTWITVPELGLSHHHICRTHNLVSPPLLPVYGESHKADGIVVKFSFAARFFQAIAREMGLGDVASSIIGITSLRSISAPKRSAGCSWRRPRINARMGGYISSLWPGRWPYGS